MPSKIRIDRISERIHQELSKMFLTEIQDPRLDGVFITDVRIDREISFCDIYVSAIEGQTRSLEILNGLERASGFIRRSLARSINLRSFPIIRFHWDPTPENADHIEDLLASIRKTDHKENNEQSENNSE